MSLRFRSVLTIAACCFLSLSACDDTKTDAKKSDAKKTAKADAKKSDDPKTDAKRADDVEAAAGGPVLVLGAAKLFDKAKPDQVLELMADGGIKLGGNALGMVTADGKVNGPDGKVFLKVGPDNKVSLRGTPIGLELVDGGGKMSVDGKESTITFGEDGSITVEPESGNGPPMSHEGCVGPVAKTCALVMFGLLAPADEEDTAKLGGPKPTAAEVPEIEAPKAEAPKAEAPKAEAKPGG